MFRFTIRDVLWFMVLAGVCVSWWIDNKRIEKTLEKLKDLQEWREAEAARAKPGDP